MPYVMRPPPRSMSAAVSFSVVVCAAAPLTTFVSLDNALPLQYMTSTLISRRLWGLRQAEHDASASISFELSGH